MIINCKQKVKIKDQHTKLVERTGTVTGIAVRTNLVRVECGRSS